MCNLRLTNSLCIKGNKIISYDTCVAEIKEDSIHEFGKYSRTTTKHINTVAGYLGLPVKHNPKSQGRVYIYEMGEYKGKSDDCLTIPVSVEVLKSMRDRRTSLVSALSTIPKFNSREKSLVHNYLEKSGIDIQGFEKLRKFNTVLKHII